MTTVRDLIQWLYTQDPNKTVLVMREYSHGWDTGTEMVDLVLPKDGDFGYSPNIDIFDTSIWFAER
jgi:hypothetical protein